MQHVGSPESTAYGSRSQKKSHSKALSMPESLQKRASYIRLLCKSRKRRRREKHKRRQWSSIGKKYELLGRR